MKAKVAGMLKLILTNKDDVKNNEGWAKCPHVERSTSAHTSAELGVVRKIKKNEAVSFLKAPEGGNKKEILTGSC